MVQIRRIKFFSPRYAVTDSQGAMTSWQGRFGREGATAEIDGESYTFRRDGRKRFVLAAGQRELAVADRSGRSGRQWGVSAAGTDYQLMRPSMWRSGFELRLGGRSLGTVRRKRRTVTCALPDDLPAVIQTFVGFVAIALWNREAAAAGGASAGAAAASG
jgi:hypothetical protein